MTLELVGTGGWAYLPRFTKDRLKSYVRRFNFVEVNVTFYQRVSPLQARRWRMRVPSEFEFSVKCNKDLTHVYEMEPTEDSFSVIDYMKNICNELRAKILVLQTPSSMRIDEAKISSLKDFFSSLDLVGLEIGWEVRSRLEEGSISALSELMLANGIIHVVDLSRSLPIVNSSLAYTRLFGLGRRGAPAYSFGNQQLAEIRKNALSLGASKVNYAFHSLRMYEDADRFLRMLENKNA